MTSKLIRYLTELSDLQSYSSSSSYFAIGCIIVRVSDHMTCSFNSCDLAIFINERGYTVIPTTGTFKKVEYFSNIEKTINFVIQFEYFCRLLIKSRDSKIDEKKFVRRTNPDLALKDVTNQLTRWGLLPEFKDQLTNLFTYTESCTHSKLLEQLKNISTTKKDLRIIQINKLLSNYNLI